MRPHTPPVSTSMIPPLWQASHSISTRASDGNDVVMSEAISSSIIVSSPCRQRRQSTPDGASGFSSESPWPEKQSTK